uniref:Uncharacterized protein n=1 Tax=Oryza nivara TaxID=4536 RepID=A0A0E0GWJ4_ORYNI
MERPLLIITYGDVMIYMKERMRGRTMDWAPSTNMVLPVMYRDSSPTRYSTVDATSFSGSSHLRSGITSPVAFSAFSFPTHTGNLSPRQTDPPIAQGTFSREFTKSLSKLKCAQHSHLTIQIKDKGVTPQLAAATKSRIRKSEEAVAGHQRRRNPAALPENPSMKVSGVKEAYRNKESRGGGGRDGTSRRRRRKPNPSGGGRRGSGQEKRDF